MVKSIPLANSIAVVTAAVFVICRLLAALTPNFIFAIGKSWFHTINFDSARVDSSLSVGAFVLGLVSSAVVAWVVAYATAELYNRWAK